MCGICGQLSFKDNAAVATADIKKMATTLMHRGPDDEGYFIHNSMGLGFRRLSIIDLEGGHQPMSDQEKSVWVVFNGEIYNFPELKAELEGYGYVFQNRSDTEVIVHGYKRWGINVLDHLNGMFGLAIWDEKNKKLTLARDRMGIKPLYYKLDNGCLAFASEMRALVAVTQEKPELDPVALNLFLRYRYTPAPLTLISGINKLAPGTRLIVENGDVRLERWWNYKPIPFNPVPKVHDAEEELLQHYQNAVKRQLLSDVPVGLLLSGGLDSGLLLALMNQQGNSWKTYTVGFGDDFHNDELAAAAFTAQTLHASNVSVKINRSVFETTLAKIITYLEEPVASASIVPMYHLCERARQDVKVVLVGQGPDELFGGYKRHLGVRYGNYWRMLPKYARSALNLPLGFLPRHEAIKRALFSLDVPERMRRYQEVFALMPAQVVDHLFRSDILPHDMTAQKLEFWRELEPLMEHTDELGGLQFLEVRSALPDELLMYSDKLSMAHGLEARVPYLDQEIVEYAERLPASFKVRLGARKWLHRRVCKNFLPKKILKRKKLGFQTPVDDWFRESLASKMNATLWDNDSLMFKYLQPHAVQRLAQDHKNGRCNHSKILFSLIVLEEWLRHYLASLK